MNADVYFNCPFCSHTILTEMDLVGCKVECADCGKEVTVPLIRDGLNPRLRKKNHPRRGGLPVANSVVAVMKRTELVQKGMISLERRQERQNLKVSHLIRNMELMVRQLDLLEERIQEQSVTAESVRPSEEPELPSMSIPQEESVSSVGTPADRLPNILYALAITLGLVVAFWWLT